MMIFIYGTVMSGLSNHDFVEDEEFIGEAYTVYNIFNMYLFANKSIPVVVNDGSYRVKGELYDVSDETLFYLDELEGEGDLYFRRVVDISTFSGIKTKAYFYMMFEKPYGAVQLEPFEYRGIDVVSFRNKKYKEK